MKTKFNFKRVYIIILVGGLLFYYNLFLTGLDNFNKYESVNKRIKYKEIDFNIPSKDIYYYLNLVGYDLKATKEEINRIKINNLINLKAVKLNLKKLIINKVVFKNKNKKLLYFYTISNLIEIKFNNIDSYLEITAQSDYIFDFDTQQPVEKFEKIFYTFNIFKKSDFYPILYFKISFDRNDYNKISFEIMELINKEKIYCYAKVYDNKNRIKITKGIIKTEKNKFNFNVYSLISMIKYINISEANKLDNIPIYDWKMLNYSLLVKLFLGNYQSRLEISEKKIKYNSKIYQCYVIKFKISIFTVSINYTFFIEKNSRIIIKITSKNKHSVNVYLYSIIEEEI